MSRYKVQERLYVTAGGKVVPEGHPDAAHLFAAKGRWISEERARIHGLLGDVSVCDVDGCGFAAKTPAGLGAHKRSHDG